METKRIETYSLFEFCDKTQQAILEGWRFDFESNENAPIAFGSMLVTGMVKAVDKPKDNKQDNKQDNTDVIIEDNTENKSEIKRGRKPKDNT